MILRPRSNESGTFDINDSIVLDPIITRQHTFSFIRCVDEEVRAELSVKVFLNPSDRSVNVTHKADLYEGSSCSTDDRETGTESNFLMREGFWHSMLIEMTSGDWSGDDFARLNYTLTNHQNGPSS